MNLKQFRRTKISKSADSYSTGYSPDFVPFVNGIHFLTKRLVLSVSAAEPAAASGLSHAASEHLNASLVASGSVCLSEAKRLLGDKENLHI